MRRYLLSSFWAGLLVAGGVSISWAATCEQLAKTALPDATVTVAAAVKGGTFAPPYGAAITNLPSFCRVAATLKPSPDSVIQIELWMPEAAWNGRLEGTGNGGFAGRISYGALATGVRKGYAVVNTDMGMGTPTGKDASIFVGRPERWKDWGWRATHEMTAAAKQLVKAFYETNPKRSFFVGCSTGGEQALMEAQRFPDDYDGIVAGAAANNRTGVHTSILWNFAVTQNATQKTAEAFIPAAKLPALTEAVVAACDALDGVKDGIVSDPRKCRFDPASIQCATADSATCLTPRQVETVRQLYRGPVNPRTGEQLYPGLPPGSEFGWDRLGTGPEPPYAPIFKWAFGAPWDWRTFDFDASFQTLRKALSQSVDATSTDLTAFRKYGHKLLAYHGWADWLVAPGESINYYEHVRAAAGDTGDFYRLFMVPGMAHCSGGPGADEFDALAAVVAWVEHDHAPEQMIAGKSAGGRVAFQSLLCPHPQTARYLGTGDTGDAKSYVCSK